MTDKYILNGKTPISCPDPMKWDEWMRKANRVVRKDTAIVSLNGIAIGEVRVST